NSKLKIASSPFTHNQQSTSQVMLWVTLAALPGILSQIYFFGLGTIYQIVLAIVVALVTETLCVKLKKEDPLLYLK
ncbi:electron transport complex subunit RsxD, partial [Escherichia coli]|nr:electron transport complex subunit RsxD [Escherichia coli]